MVRAVGVLDGRVYAASPRIAVWMISDVVATSPLGMSVPSRYTFSVALATFADPSGMLIGVRPVRCTLKFSVDAVAQQPIARCGDQLAVGVHLEDAVAGVELFAAVALHDKEAVALDGHVGRAGTDFDGALLEVGRDRGDHRAQADLTRIRAAVGVGRARTQALRLQELRGERRIGGLEAHGVRVGQVVADHVDGGFRGGQAGERRAQCDWQDPWFISW